MTLKHIFRIQKKKKGLKYKGIGCTKKYSYAHQWSQIMWILNLKCNKNWQII